MHLPRAGALAFTFVVLAGACSSSASKNSQPAALKRAQVDVSAAATAPFAAHGSVGQVYLVDAPKSAPMLLLDKDNGLVTRRDTDAHGSLIFRDVPAGAGYRVASDDRATVTAPVAVTAWDNPPDASTYAKQSVGDGYGYVTMRDGVQLAMTVKLPGPVDKGPYPTVIEYSGYTPADPDSPQPSTLITQNIGLRDRRREHARHRLFGWRVQLLRTTAVDRRLRHRRDDRGAAVGRAPQSRHGRHLVPGDLAVVRRAAASAAPRRDRAALGHRRHVEGHALARAASSTTGSRSTGRRIASTTRKRRPRAARVGR